MNSKEVEVEGNSQKSNQNSESGHMSHLALDLGGSLIKLVYFSRKSTDGLDDDKGEKSANEGTRLPGSLHFTKFKYTEINDCFDLIRPKMLGLGIGDNQHNKTPTSDKIMIIKATGGGAYKYSSIFEEKLGISIEQVDEMDAVVDGATFLLKTVHQEAFTHINGQKEYVQIDDTNLYPFMIANMGTGFTLTAVDAKDKFKPVGGTDIGGGTFWGLGKLLTKCKSFDELVELSKRGDNKAVDILIGDMNGGRDYTKPGFNVLSTFVASSFGRAMYDDRELEDYKPEDIALSLLRMISNHIGQYACMNALRFGHKRIVFSGSFIRSHASMDVISNTINFWSRGDIQAVFLGHQGFIGAIGTFLKYRNYDSNGLAVHNEMMDRSEENGELSDNQSIECSIYV